MARADAQRNIQAILDAARAALAEDPKATMNETAERAGVARVTLHRHFATREALLERLSLIAIATLDERLEAAALEQGNARDAIHRATRTWLEESAGGGWRIAKYFPFG